MISKRMFLLLLLIGFLVLNIGSFSINAEETTLSWIITCDGFTSNGGTITFNRDNTGEGVERFILTAVDGKGDVIFDPIVDSVPVGTTWYIDSSVSYRWTRRPTSNPITVRMISRAGLNFSEQILFLGTVHCAELSPPATSTPNAATPAPTTTVHNVSPSVNINTDPPKVEQSNDIFANETGTLYVENVSANLRSGDGLHYTVVGVVGGGTRLLVRGINEKRTWWLVQAGTLRGWISDEVVIISGNLADVPTIEARGEVQPPTFYVYKDTYIYTSPSQRSIATCLVNGDLEYEIVGRNRTASWFGIAANCSGNKVVGWILAESGAIRNAGSLSIPTLP